MSDETPDPGDGGTDPDKPVYRAPITPPPDPDPAESPGPAPTGGDGG